MAKVVYTQWMRVASRLSRDMAVWFLSFVMATWLRFAHWENLWNYLPTVFLSAVTCCGINYIAGLYSRERLQNKRFLYEVMLVTAAILAGLAVAWMVGSIRFSNRLGRGVTVMALPMIWTGIVFHHWLLFHRRLDRRD